MPTLSIDNELVAAIALFSTNLENQQPLINILEESFATLKQQPGFVSLSIHKSLDGLRVAIYDQWESQDDFEMFFNSAAGKELIEQVSAYPVQSHLFEIIASQSMPETPVPPKITKGGYLTHFAEFRMKPENQPKLVELQKEYLPKSFEENKGLVSASFHRSLDGLMSINYGQWLSQEAFEEILKVPGFEKGKGYWVGLAENEFHLYDVVFAEPAD
jgi:quinol monooxygenase YgiN